MRHTQTPRPIAPATIRMPSARPATTFARAPGAGPSIAPSAPVEHEPDPEGEQQAEARVDHEDGAHVWLEAALRQDGTHERGEEDSGEEGHQPGRKERALDVEDGSAPPGEHQR